MNEPTMTTLGKTDIKLPPMGIGAWAWGDSFFWGYGKEYKLEDIQGAFDTSLQAEINFFDTAEVYGMGRSEKNLGLMARGTDKPVLIATKFFPLPWRLSTSRLNTALRASLRRLGLAQVDLYQVHMPTPPMPIETWAEGLAQAVEQGLTRSVGVSNYDADQMRRAHAVLASHGIPLASNQLPYSLLNRKIEHNGLLQACQELGVTVIAYSPLAQGMLTGKYSPDHPFSGVRARRYPPQMLARIQPLLEKMRQIGSDNYGRTIAQVALNWTICKGTFPIPGAKNAHQAQENLGALGWRLSDEQVAQLDDLSSQLVRGD